MRSWRFLIIVAALLSGCVESTFDLSSDSRLPEWFSLPSGLSRGDVSVKLTYLAPSRSSDDAVLELRRKDGVLLSKVTGQFCWHPAMESMKNKYGGFDPGLQVRFAYIRAGGKIEVVEHTSGPVFRINEQPALRKAALATPTCDKG
jgi:hypothetical protein